MSVTALKYVVGALSVALFAALLVVGEVDAQRHRVDARAEKAAAEALLNPQIQRGKRAYIKYSCNACHGMNGGGGIENVNAQTGGEVNGLTRVSETYTLVELLDKIRNGVADVDKADPTGPEPPLRMPAYKELIAGQELRDLAAFVLVLRPALRDSTKARKPGGW